MSKILVTHNGTFHADDVFAVAAFLMANNQNKEWQVVRSRNEEVVKNADAVIDVGGEYDIGRLRFDHHQIGGAGIRENTIPYASFGLVWNIYGEMITGDKRVKDDVEKKLIIPVDANDSGVEITKSIIDDIYPYNISNLVEDYNITWKDEANSSDRGESLRYEAFMKLVGIATELLENIIRRSKHKHEAKALVIDAYNNATDKRLIVMDNFYPWQDILIGFPEPVFVVFPGQDGWTLRTVPKEKNSFDSRKLLPESWAGKREGEIAEAIGIPDALFCHTARFIATAKTKEAILKMAEIALN
jgi:uncharacterized UPF0160 family protein